MFSNRSVSVQPSAPPIEYAGVPDDFRIFAALSMFDHVFGALTPAALKAGTLYQTSDLLAALKTSAYSLPLYVPSCCHAGAKFAAIVDFAYVIGFSFPCVREGIPAGRVRFVGNTMIDSLRRFEAKAHARAAWAAH